MNPLSPLQREYAVAITADKVIVLRLKLPGVFRASIDKVLYEARRDNAAIGWEDGRVVIGDSSYRPISFHGDDAKELVSMVQR